MNSLIEKNKIFFDRIAGFYDFLLRAWLNKIQKTALENIKIDKNSKVLDAGFGTGNLLLELSKRNDLRLYGIDISKKMLDIARRKLGDKAELKLMPVENLKKGKFDYIFSTEAFHHYADQKKSMKNFYKVLKKEGKLIIVDLDFGVFLNKIFHIIEPGNSGMNSVEDFRRLLKKHKFRNIHIKRIGLFAILAIGEK